MIELSSHYEDIVTKLKGFQPLMNQATMNRTPFELKYFVAGRHVNPMQQYRQLVIELQVADGAIRACILGQKKRRAKKKQLEIEIDRLKYKLDGGDGLDDWDKDSLKAQIEEKEAEVEEFVLAEEQENRAFIGKLKEVEIMYHLIKMEYPEWMGLTEEQQLTHEKDYWVDRLARQAANELAACGRISTGMVEAIRQLPREEYKAVLKLAHVEDLNYNQSLQVARDEAMKVLSSSTEFKTEPGKLPEPSFYPLKLRKDAPVGYPEDRIVNADHIDIVIGCLHRNIEKDNPLTAGFEVPSGKNFMWIREECPSADLIGDYKYRLAIHAESIGASHLFILDDDIEAPVNTLRKLFKHEKDIVGAWYPRKLDPPDSASMVKDGDSKKGVPKGKGLIECDWSLTAGCTLYKLDALKKLPRPWFRTTNKCTEDTYLTQLGLEHGIKSFLDRDLRVVHVDKAKGKKFTIEQIPA